MKMWHVIAALTGLGIFAAVVGGNGGATTGNPTQTTAASTASSSSDSETDKQKQISNLRFLNAEIAAKLVKDAQRNPDSLQWISISTNDDASLVCMSYRSQNGFGGMTIEPAVSINGKITNSEQAWKKYCAGKLHHDVKDLVEIGLEHGK